MALSLPMWHYDFQWDDKIFQSCHPAEDEINYVHVFHYHSSLVHDNLLSAAV